MPPTIAAASPDTMPMPHLMLQLRRPAAQEQALHDADRSTARSELAELSSLAQRRAKSARSSVRQPRTSQTITNWLSQHGFTVNTVYPNRMVIDFSGTAGQVRTAFHTEIHYLDVNGVTRFANVSDPQIPAALAPAVVGVVALHNIPPQADDAADAKAIFAVRLHLRPRLRLSL